MQLYRKYYNELTPAQRREFLSGRFTSPEAAEQQLKSHALANRNRSTMLGQKDLRSSQIEQLWRRVDDFLAEAEAGAANAAGDPAVASELSAKCAGFAEELKQTESRIKHTPYGPDERAALLQRNGYYASRLQALSKIVSKNKP